MGLKNDPFKKLILKNNIEVNNMKREDILEDDDFLHSEEWNIFNQVMQASSAEEEFNLTETFSDYAEGLNESKETLSTFLLCSLQYVVNTQHRELGKITLQYIRNLRKEFKVSASYEKCFEILKNYKNWLLTLTSEAIERENHDEVVTQLLLTDFDEVRNIPHEITSSEKSINRLYELFRRFIALPRDHLFSLTAYLNYAVQLITLLYQENRKESVEISWITFMVRGLFSSLIEQQIEKPPLLNVTLFFFFKIWITLYHVLVNQEPFQILEEDFNGLNKNYLYNFMEALWRKANGQSVNIALEVSNLCTNIQTFQLMFFPLANEIQLISSRSKAEFIMMVLRRLPFYAYQKFERFPQALQMIEPGAQFKIQDNSFVFPMASYITDEEAKLFCLTNQLSGFEAIAKDGNCFFRAVLVALSENQEDHLDLRAAAIEHITLNSEKFLEFFANIDALTDYIEKMASPDAWAEDIILNVVAKLKKCKINIQDLTKENGEILLNSFVITSPDEEHFEKEITLIRVNNNHYHVINTYQLGNQIGQNPAGVPSTLFRGERRFSNLSSTNTEQPCLIC